MHSILILPATLLPALGRRVAGGAFQQWTGINVGDTPARLFFGLTVAAVALVAGLAPVACAFAAVAVWIGTTIPMFGGIAMGRSGNPVWRDAIGLAAHGVLGMAVLALFLVWPSLAPHGTALASAIRFGTGIALSGIVVLLAAGLMIVVAYEIGWCISGLSGDPRLPLGLRGGSELGEALWGFVIGVFVIRAIGGM